MHKRAISSSSDVVPLLYCHSWPGGIIEVVRIIDALTSLTDDGGPAFHLVAPSVPGCGFSEASDTHGLGTKEVADVFDRLMLKLGYRHYIAHGTEWYVVLKVAPLNWLTVRLGDSTYVECWPFTTLIVVWQHTPPLRCRICVRRR